VEKFEYIVKGQLGVEVNFFDISGIAIKYFCDIFANVFIVTNWNAERSLSVFKTR
jgi:hypothetical protein